MLKFLQITVLNVLELEGDLLNEIWLCMEEVNGGVFVDIGKTFTLMAPL